MSTLNDILAPATVLPQGGSSALGNYDPASALRFPAPRFPNWGALADELLDVRERLTFKDIGFTGGFSSLQSGFVVVYAATLIDLISVSSDTGFLRRVNRAGASSILSGHQGVISENDASDPWESSLPRAFALFPCNSMGQIANNERLVIGELYAAGVLGWTATNGITVRLPGWMDMTIYMEHFDLTLPWMEFDLNLALWMTFSGRARRVTLPENAEFEAFGMGGMGIEHIRARGCSFNLPHSHQSVSVSNNRMEAAALNQFFADLAPGDAEITVFGNPGTATCDPSIATAKGYTITGI